MSIPSCEDPGTPFTVTGAITSGVDGNAGRVRDEDEVGRVGGGIERELPGLDESGRSTRRLRKSSDLSNRQYTLGIVVDNAGGDDVDHGKAVEASEVEGTVQISESRPLPVGV